MPSFVVEFESNYGPERRLFTIDGDRPLRSQMSQVLEELRLADRMLVGGPDDEIAVYWNQRELDLSVVFESLGVTVDRPLVLRMRPKAVAAVPAKRPVNWRSIIRPPIEGAIGALVAWFITMSQTDVRSPITTVNQVDLVVAALLTGFIGLALALGLIVRRESSVLRLLPSMLVAPAAGLATAIGIMLVERSPTVGIFLVGRILAWALALALVSLFLTAPRQSLPASRWWSAPVFGALTGIIAAMLFSLPGPSLLLQALAFTVAGLGVGFAALAYPTWRAETALV